MTTATDNILMIAFCWMLIGPSVASRRNVTFDIMHLFVTEHRRNIAIGDVQPWRGVIGRDADLIRLKIAYNSCETMEALVNTGREVAAPTDSLKNRTKVRLIE